MKRVIPALAGVFLVGVLLLGGCGFAGGPNADSARGENAATVRSKVKLDGTYMAGSTIRIRMVFDKEGGCRYGYTGIYHLEQQENGDVHLTLVYYASEAKQQMAGEEYLIRPNGDGTYARAACGEDGQADFSKASMLRLEDGTDGILSGDVFDGSYRTGANTRLIFCADGSFVSEVEMQYAADRKRLEMIGADSSTIYKYEAQDDYDRIVLFREDDGSEVMTLEKEE